MDKDTRELVANKMRQTSGGLHPVKWEYLRKDVREEWLRRVDAIAPIIEAAAEAEGFQNGLRTIADDVAAAKQGVINWLDEYCQNPEHNFGIVNQLKRHICPACMVALKQPEVSFHSLNSPDEKPKIVTLCGSTRFVETFNEYRIKKTLEGEIVLGIELVVPQTHQQDPQHSDYMKKKMLDELHKRKIDLSDYILVLNVGGYIGESTRGEINYAESIGVPVCYLEALRQPQPCPDCKGSGELNQCEYEANR